MAPLPLLFPLSRSESLSDLADSPEFVLPIYGLVLLPLGLYVYHDIIDSRWRALHHIARYMLFYMVLYILAAAALIGYIYVEIRAEDYKEVGAGVIALVLGSHRLWTLIRLTFILRAHKALVSLLQYCNMRLAKLSNQMTHFRDMKYRLFQKPAEGERKRHLYISASLFDDDYPGESARIKWIARQASVHEDDIEELSARVGIWLRVALRSSEMGIWEVLTSCRYDIRGLKLYDKLKDVIFAKSAPVIPKEICENPGEELINLDGSKDVASIGKGLFWTGVKMRDEEVSEVMAELPAGWTSGTLSGKEMLCEIGVVLILTGLRDDALEVLNEDEEGRLWEGVADCFGYAVCSCAKKGWDERDSDEEDGDMTAGGKKMDVDVIKRGVLSLRNEKLPGHDSEPDSMKIRLIHTIRAAYYAGYVVESVLGEHAQHIHSCYNCPEQCGLYQVDIVLGLYEILLDTGLCENSAREKEEEEEDMKSGEIWSMICDLDDRGVCPGSEFRGLNKRAGRVAERIYDAFRLRAEFLCVDSWLPIAK